jgi:hypothetical protein
MFGLGPRLPINDDERAWIDEGFRRLGLMLGNYRMLDAQAVLPSDEFFPDRYDRGYAGVRMLYRRVCKYMKVDPEKHNVDLSRNRAETIMRALVERGTPDRLMVSAGLPDASSENAGAETDSQELYRRVTFQVTLDHPIWPRAGLTP